MTFRILGTGMGPIVLSERERQRVLPDIDSLLEMYFNKHLAENLMEHVKNEPARSENIVNKVVDAIAENEAKKYQIQSITANHKKNAFTVVWGNGSHTIVHLQPGDTWDDEKALAMCFVKHLMGDKGSFNDIFTEEMPAKIKHIGKVEPAEETVSSALNEMGETAENMNVAMKELVHALIDEPVKVQRYDLFLMDPCGDKTKIYHQGTDEEIHKAMRTYRMKHYPILEANRTPYRMWMIKDNLMVDFGAGSYFMVPGMDHDTFVKGK